MRWPSTPIGKIVLYATFAYLALWAGFVVSPAWKSAVLETPYIGPVVQVFLALYVAALIFWAVWTFILS